MGQRNASGSGGTIVLWMAWASSAILVISVGSLVLSSRRGRSSLRSQTRGCELRLTTRVTILGDPKLRH